jgi:L-threonylcarbamoyladenylate synthase
MMRKTRKALPAVLPTHTPALRRRAVGRAVRLLRRGEPVALPTETVYGLAANALDPAAVARIFAIKERPAHNPIIVHVASLAMARAAAARWPRLADRLARAFWPGPLTLVLPRAAAIPGIVAAGGPTVGIRWPRHPVIEAVIRACGFPLAAPSANLASQLSSTTAAHVRAALGERVELILDGGPSPVGVESTVLDLTVEPPRVLRPGMIHEESLLAVTGGLQPPAGAAGAGGPLRSPGLLTRHYAPRARLILWPRAGAPDLAAFLARRGLSPERSWAIVHARLPSAAAFGGVVVLPREAAAFARALYAELHRCDAAGARCIAVEEPPLGPEWSAIADRLRRAAA